MFPMERLEDLVQRIVDSVHPRRIILFGSAARDEMKPGSDMDVLVVMPDGTHRRKTATTVYRSLRRFGHPIDIIVATENDLAANCDNPGLIFKQALAEGKDLYRAA